MNFKLAIILFASTQLCASSPVQAPCECTRQYEPICGSDGQTYNNRCLLNCVSSTNSALTIAKYGSCEETNSGICGCSLDYIPVCGSDAKTYPNTCHLSCKRSDNPSLDVAYEGECKPNIPHPNKCSCPDYFKAVCGSDSVTYHNDCLLNCATANNSGLSIAYYGRCKSDPVYKDTIKIVEPHF